MFLKNSGARLTALVLGGMAAMVTMAGAAHAAKPEPWQIDLQPAASPVMEQIESFHDELLVIITLVSLFVLALLVWVVVRYNHRANPVPSKTSHNALLEFAWTFIPVVILVIIAIPSFKLLYYEMELPKADVTVKAIGKQWFWSYQYPGQGDFTFDSLGLSDADALKAGKPRLLGVDNPIFVPVNKNVVVETTGADVIHSWALPAFGVKMDAVPGRINQTWFKATKEGVYYGQCSELCGARHAYMPIEVHVVSQAAYEAWLADAKKKFASNGGATRLAALQK